MIESTVYSRASKAQRQLIDYWASVGRGKVAPSRDEIDPGVLRSHLAHMSIVSYSRCGTVQLRVVGSKVKRVVRAVEASDGAKANQPSAVGNLLASGLVDVVESGRPVIGRSVSGDGQHVWLRLPLADTPDGDAVILCHDTFIAGELIEDSGKFCRTLSNTPNGLAA